MRLQSIFIVPIVILSAGAVAWFIADSSTIRAAIGDDKIFESIFQFLLVTVIGGAVAYLYKEFDRIREQRHALRELQGELLEAYNRAKGVRRHLRARLGEVSPKTKVPARNYKQQMCELNDSQLIFETYSKHAQDRQLWFRGPHALAGSLRTIEEYLNEMIDEYERKFSHFAGDPAVLELNHLPKLREFLSKHHEGCDFQTRFQDPMTKMLNELGKAILR